MYNERIFSLPLPSVLKDQQDFMGLKFASDFLPLKGNGTATLWTFYISVELLIYFYVEFVHLLGSTGLPCIRLEKDVLLCRGSFAWLMKSTRFFSYTALLQKKLRNKKCMLSGGTSLFLEESDIYFGS